MDARENALVAISQIPDNAGHALHRGTPREAFIREFLVAHLPANVAIGTGEIIDANSQPGERRNQFDIVIHRENFPKLDFGGGVSGFLVESVIATIEVKSTLNQEELQNATRAAIASKALVPNTVSSFRTGYIPPRVLNYVVAYNGPASMLTVHGWLPRIHENLEVAIRDLPTEPDARIQTPSPSLDAVFVLQKGFLYFDNVPYGFASEQIRRGAPNLKWVVADTRTGNLLLFFLFLQAATANLQARWLNPLPYLQNFRLPNISYRE